MIVIKIEPSKKTFSACNCKFGRPELMFYWYIVSRFTFVIFMMTFLIWLESLLINRYMRWEEFYIVPRVSRGHLDYAQSVYYKNC